MHVEDSAATAKELTDLLAARSGHFKLESGHHGNLWLDLELLCLQPRRVAPFAAELAEQLSRYRIEAVCSPLVEGAFVALMVASHLDVEFYYAERFDHPESDALYPVEYRIPHALRGRLRGKRVAIVNDVINAGSAVRGALSDLQTCGAQVLAIATLVVLGESAARFAAANDVPLQSIAQLPNRYWLPSECPLCAERVPLDSVGELLP